MKKLTLPFFLSIASLGSFAQGQFTIHGRIELLSKSKNVRLSGYEPAPIQPDGSFEIKGQVGQPDIALIMTDSSGASAIWLEPGEYTLTCKEVTLPNIKGALFRTPTLKGPANAELHNDFECRQFSRFGVAAGSGTDSAMKARTKERAIRYMDSVLARTNSSPVLPEMIRMGSIYTGDEAVRRFIQRLTPELRNSQDIAMIEDDFKRKDKIKAEKVFENFTLQDVAGNNFSLASLSGKKVIVIDLWASDCGPCRMHHPALKKWYDKYAASGLEIVSVSIDEDKAKWLKAVQEDGMGSWTNVYDPKGFKATLMQDYYIPFIPFGFLLDQNRTIVIANEGSWIKEKDIAGLLGVGVAPGDGQHN